MYGSIIPISQGEQLRLSNTICPGLLSKSGTKPGVRSGQVRVLYRALQNAVANMGLTAGLSLGFSVSFSPRPVGMCVLKREMVGRGGLSGMHCINNI